MNEQLQVAARLRELREACGTSQEDMARDLGVSLAVYQGYERDGADIPISAIYQAANKFGVELTEILYGDTARLDSFHVVRAGQGRTVDRYPGYAFSDLAFRYKGKLMQPLLVTLDPSDAPAALVSHPGQEFNYCLSGAMTLVFDGREIALSAGDSVYFNPRKPHGQRCAGDSPAIFLTVIAE